MKQSSMPLIRRLGPDNVIWSNLGLGLIFYIGEATSFEGGGYFVEFDKHYFEEGVVEYIHMLLTVKRSL